MFSCYFYNENGSQSLWLTISTIEPYSRLALHTSYEDLHALQAQIAAALLEYDLSMKGVSPSEDVKPETFPVLVSGKVEFIKPEQVARFIGAGVMFPDNWHEYYNGRYNAGSITPAHLSSDGLYILSGCFVDLPSEASPV